MMLRKVEVSDERSTECKSQHVSQGQKPSLGRECSTVQHQTGKGRLSDSRTKLAGLDLFLDEPQAATEIWTKLRMVPACGE